MVTYGISSAISLVTVLIKIVFIFTTRITLHLYQRTVPLEIKLSDVTGQSPVRDSSLFSAVYFLLTFVRTVTLGHISHHWYDINAHPSRSQSFVMTPQIYLREGIERISR